MLLKEDAALERWCPMSRTSNGLNNDVTINRPEDSDVVAETRCLASKCMAWRWHIKKGFLGFGYCGLAGNPDE